MLKDTSHTILSKIGIAVSNLLTILIVTKLLGTSARGSIALFIANMTLIIHVSSIMGGSAVAYLSPKRKTTSLLMITYSWSFIISIIGGLCFLFIKQLSFFEMILLSSISFLNGINATNLMVLIGKERIKKHNTLALLQPLILISFFGVLLFSNDQNVTLYYISLLTSFLICFILSSFYIAKIKESKLPKSSIQELFNLGFKAQGANIAQFFNYRMSYWFLSSSELGIYANAIALTEAIWIFGRSLAQVLYSEVINEKNISANINNCIKNLKMTFLVTSTAIIILSFLPEEIYTLLFNKDYKNVGWFIILMSPGILAIPLSANLSSYFGGIGKFEISLYSSLLGLIITTILCFTLVKNLRITGACYTTSIAYSFSLLFLLIVFIKQTKIKLNCLLFSKDDLFNLLDLFASKKR